MARICIDARFYSTGTGVARYIKALLNNLATVDKANDYTIVVRPDAVEELKHKSPKHWHIVGLDIVHYSLAEQTTFLRYLNKEKFDLVYFTMFNHPIFYRGKSVVMIHDLIMHFYPPRPLWHPRTWAYRFVMWHAAHWSTKILNNSQITKNDVVTHLKVPSEKCVVTLLAVEDTFKPVTDKEKIAQTKAKYGITKPFLFFINAWRPHKGLPELIEAYLTIKKTHDVQLVVGGKPNPAFPAMIDSVEHGKRVTDDILTPGFISDEDMMTLYSSCAIYIHPEHYAGFGLGILESMACGGPVVAADNACLKEVGGKAAVYFKTKSDRDLAKKLDELLSNDRERHALREKGLDRIHDFSFQRMTEETVAVFEDVLAK